MKKAIIIVVVVIVVLLVVLLTIDYISPWGFLCFESKTYCPNGTIISETHKLHWYCTKTSFVPDSNNECKSEPNESCGTYKYWNGTDCRPSLKSVLNTSAIIDIDIRLYTQNRTVVFPEKLDAYGNATTNLDVDWFLNEISEYNGGNYTLIMADKEGIVYFGFPFHLKEQPDTLFWEGQGPNEGGMIVYDYASTYLTLPYNEFLDRIIILYNNETVAEYNNTDLQWQSVS
jgi:hypothetical protein